MDDKKNMNPAPELNDELLDKVNGSYSRGERKAKCRRCRDEFPESSLFGGYCSKCLEELDKMGVHPPI